MNSAIHRSGKETLLIFSFILLSVSFPSFCAENADSVLNMVQQKLKSLKSLTADFTQSFSSRALGSSFEEKGKLFIKIPGQMRWDYEIPEEKIAICNGMESWLYIQEDNTVLKGNLESSDSSRALISLLTGTAELKNLFEGEVVSQSRNDITIRIRSKEENDQFDHLIVTVGRKSKMIVTIELIDALKNRMTYSFENIRENPEIDPGIFRFTIPQGAQIKFE